MREPKRAYKSFDSYMIEQLKDHNEAKVFLEIAIKAYDKDGDIPSLMHALRLVTEACGGVPLLAEKSQLNRQNLYKLFTGKTTPRLDTTLAILHGLGFSLTIENTSHSVLDTESRNRAL